MQTLHLQGGFGEKGRTAIAIEDGSTCIILEAGIKVGASPDGCHPLLSRPADQFDALFISHANDDHLGALGWMLGQGFTGPVFMMPSSFAEMDSVLSNCANDAGSVASRLPDTKIELFAPGDELVVGDQEIATGHSGHVVGGVWFSALSGGKRTVYCGDLFPESKVLPMTTMPECDLMILDCSYGDDMVDASERAQRIVAWVESQPNGCVLPTPLSGRSLEFLAILLHPIAIAAEMDEPLKTQLAQPDLLFPGAPETLIVKIDNAFRWRPGSPLSNCPLLVYDWMGTAGPALEQAERASQPVLLTGHFPAGSPGRRMLDLGIAAWHRLPTHPIMPQNRKIWESTGHPSLLGRSCGRAVLQNLKSDLPSLNATLRTGDSKRLG